MYRKSLMIAALALAPWFSAGTADAQTLNMDLSPLVQHNAALWNQSMIDAKRVADNYFNDVQRFRQQTGYTGPMPSPVSTADLMRSNREMQQAFDSSNAAWHNNSARTSAAVDRWVIGAIRGQGTYYNPSTGQQYQLPWTHNQYHTNQWGQAVPGPAPNGWTTNNFYPYYGN